MHRGLIARDQATPTNTKTIVTRALCPSVMGNSSPEAAIVLLIILGPPKCINGK